MPNRTWLQDFAGSGGNSPTAQQLLQAFDTLNYDFAYVEEQEAARNYLADFTQRRGHLSIATLVAIARRFVPAPVSRDVSNGHHGNITTVIVDSRALLEPQTPQEEDTLFALAILGVLRTADAPSLLLPYLASPRAQERWLAAFGLAGMRDERVLPVLEQMLVEFIGPDQPRSLDGALLAIFPTLRHRLLRLLAEWGDSRVVPFIRAGLLATVHAEEVDVPEPHGPAQEFNWGGGRYTRQEAWMRFSGVQLTWVDEEHLFVYTLGRLGAFGALEGVPTRRGVYSWQDVWIDEGKGRYRHKSLVPESHANEFRANVWRVHLCFGALEAQFHRHVGTIYRFSDAPDLAEAVERLLAGKFGMDEAARRRAMEDYDQASWVSWTPLKNGWYAGQVLKDEEGDIEKREEL